MKYLRIKDLIEILKQYDGELPVILNDEGCDHQYGITKQGIEIMKNPYFGNDPDAEEAYGFVEDENGDYPDMDFLILGSF